MGNQKGFVPIILIIIISVSLLLAAGLWYFIRVVSIYDWGEYKTETTSSHTAGTANWKTYQNISLGISIKYPPGWIYQETYKTAKTFIYIKDKQYQSETIIFGDKQTKNYQGEEVEPYPAPNFDIAIIKDLTIEDLSLDEIVTSYINQELISEVQNVTVDSSPAKLVKQRGCMAGDCVKVFIKNIGSLVILNSSGEASSSLKAFDQILSTFKFDNTSLTTEETGQYTYCASDKDCWCRGFDGTKFIPDYKAPSVCEIKTNRCQQCLYE